MKEEKPKLIKQKEEKESKNKNKELTGIIAIQEKIIIKKRNNGEQT